MVKTACAAQISPQCCTCRHACPLCLAWWAYHCKVWGGIWLPKLTKRLHCWTGVHGSESLFEGLLCACSAAIHIQSQRQRLGKLCTAGSPEAAGSYVTERKQEA